jgi:acetoacetate decarboxylase
MRNYSPVGWNSAKAGLWHRFIGLNRAICRKSRASHIQKLVAQNFNVQGTGKHCDMCGYELATIRLENDWTFQACTATIMPTALAAQGFRNWCERLPAAVLENRPRETHLQTSGH